MVAAGVPRARVLAGRYRRRRQCLGAPHGAGVVEVGARADLLLLLASDPLVAPLPLVPAGVIVRGRWHARAEIEAKLAGIARRIALR